MSAVTSKIIQLFLVLFIGIIAKKLKIIDTNFIKKLSSFIAKIAMPMLIISAFQKDFDINLLKDGAIIFALFGASMILAVVISHFAFKKCAVNEKYMLEFATVFSNCGFLGFPIYQAMYGEMGLFFGVFCNAFFNLFVWSYGLMIMKKGASNGEKVKIKAREMLVNPGTVAVLIGLLLFVFSVKLPEVIKVTCSSVGELTFTLSMIVIGGIFADMDTKELVTDMKVWISCILKLVLFPAIAFAFCALFGVAELSTYIIVIAMACPTASFAVILSEIYGANSKLGAHCVCLSTLMSLASLPLTVYLLKMYFGA